MRDAWGTQRDLPSVNYGAFDRKGEEEVGFSDDVVVEEVTCTGVKRVGVERPSTERDRDSELMFFVALAMEGDEAAAIRLAELDEWTVRGSQGRRLIVMTVKGAERPFEL